MSIGFRIINGFQDNAIQRIQTKYIALIIAIKYEKYDCLYSITFLKLSV